MSNTAKRQTQTVESSTSLQSLSYKVWGIDWQQHLPRNLTGTIRVEIKSYAEAMPLISSLFPEVYKIDGKSHFYEDGVAAFKQKYYEAAGDFFVFYDGAKNEQVAGMAICTILDWSSYNFRNIAIAPEYQESGLYLLFFDMLCEVLSQYQVSRIEGDVAPTNRHHIHVLNKMGYLVSAMSYSERWGVLLHITKYLNKADEERFTQVFSMTANSDASANHRFSKKKPGAA